ncbi:MAG TPA: ribosome-binding factor A [Kofleriaceae bacterium]|jgi:ribosome-binding factor A
MGNREFGAERAIGPLRREIERSLSLALATAHDARLQSLIIIDVQPAPDASRFGVFIEAPRGSDRAVITAALEHASGRLREEIARSLQRKRTPELAFIVEVAS